MCFSATASFAAAATIALVGAVAIAKAETWREKPLAAMPLLFAAQQAIEGGVWLNLDGVPLPLGAPFLANAFAFIALAVWPFYSPVALALVEPRRLRRQIMIGLVFLGAAVGCFGAWHVAAAPYAACILRHSISYKSTAPFPHVIFAAYLACTCLPLVLSSHRALRWFGTIVITGFIAAALFYLKSRFSVWCFFAALASATVYWHFASPQRTAPEPKFGGA